MSDCTHVDGHEKDCPVLKRESDEARKRMSEPHEFGSMLLGSMCVAGRWFPASWHPYVPSEIAEEKTDTGEPA